MVEEQRQIDPPKDMLVWQLTQEITALGKAYLVILEDMRDFEQLLGDKDFLTKRKKILDNTNDTKRKLISFLERFDVKFK